MRDYSTTEAIVLRHARTGEADRVVTLFTQEFGRVSCIAKGVRKVSSSKKSALEPGCTISCSLSMGKGMPIITQAVLIQDVQGAYKDLHISKALHQILEICDALLADGEPDAEMYSLLASSLQVLVEWDAYTSGNRRELLVERLQQMLRLQGYYVDPQLPISQNVEHAIEKKLRSFDYLTVSGV
ncbi:MAG: repair protein RecO protein [Microgenomates group bacterium GW2011_GWF2_45_18]|nr:MAG: repair protein RecO protein [Microgenomates group bacterium GW2011_GWF1_44_10]KKU02344.1 MAG: repair protein RecO protein [Microgenomates group bacterium GW2011_GWF2_45_18]OGJ41676.1 MAG: DNA repair protein RecO [Candidatus Pacebacteria bacterium RIFOXYB1_FULL_44_10]HAU99189.1 DNA repair protein RecO [Candidatus Paceibacterota bacterium]HAX01719.1 DNA repair protein RecO [Candidatus Paceibacterota bacterium]